MTFVCCGEIQLLMLYTVLALPAWQTKGSHRSAFAFGHCHSSFYAWSLVVSKDTVCSGTIFPRQRGSFAR